MILQYIGNKPKLFFDPPWLLGGPYIFESDLDDFCCEVHPTDGRDMVEMSPRTFAIVAGEDEEAPESKLIFSVDDDPLGETNTEPEIELDPNPEAPQEEVLEFVAPVDEIAAGQDDQDSKNICYLCGKEFKTAHGLKIHMSTKHPEVGSGEH